METIEDLIKKISTSDYDQETRYYEMYFQKNMKHDDVETWVKKCLDLPKITKKSTPKKTKKKETKAPENKRNSLFICKICKSDDVVWFQKQTRSADEAMTVFLECRQCFAKWKQ